ncbi:MAG: glycosyltransferase family 2 protein [Armatimonadetes bacterium]|nr:glycosyltransferase family 2 protein [Armatimonadota bacterium]
MVESSYEKRAASYAFSVVVPFYNEAENVPILWKELHAALSLTGSSWEVLWVDDGSTDGTSAAMESALVELPPPPGACVQFLRLASNRGQSASLGVGIRAARSAVIVIMDGDLQNDPADIPRMLECLTSEVDIVAGWRRHREDALLHRRVPSLLANYVLRLITGVPVHDLGCGLKVIRAEVLRQTPLYGDRHRYLVPLCAAGGAVIKEIEVHHRSRKFGKSKYGLLRTVNVLLDATTLRLFVRSWNRPLRMFGGVGLLTGSLGFLLCAYLAVVKLTQHVSIGGRPLLLLGVLLMVLGAQFLCFGLLAETLLRIYQEGKTSGGEVIRLHRVIDGGEAAIGDAANSVSSS